MLAQRPWIYDLAQHAQGRDAIELLQRLRDHDFEAVVVGGCVRDALLGRPIGDIDLATNARPEQVLELFPRSVPVGMQFGVVVVPGNAGPIEVATFRSDAAYIDGRHPETVAFTTEAEDVERRDFTINGLVADIFAGEIRDRVGGLADLDDRLLRTIGNPKQRFTEDRLRILRALRFAATHDLAFADPTWEAIKDTDVVDVSRERIWQEWRKVFANHHQPAVWQRWRQLNDQAGQQRALHPDLEPADQSLLADLAAATVPDCAWLLTWSQLTAIGAWLNKEPLLRPSDRHGCGCSNNSLQISLTIALSAK